MLQCNIVICHSDTTMLQLYIVSMLLQCYYRLYSINVTTNYPETSKLVPDWPLPVDLELTFWKFYYTAFVNAVKFLFLPFEFDSSSPNTFVEQRHVSSLHHCCTMANFRIEKKIGRGQFSEVYKATYLLDGQLVALKKVQV